MGILYSTTSGVSGERLKVTDGDKVEALLNKFKYLRAKERQTGSSTSSTVLSSFLSDSLCLRVEQPFPISPLTENLTASFEVSI